MEPMQAEDYLKDIPFTVASLVEKCSEPGSYERAVGNAVCNSIRRDIERARELIAELRKEKRP